MSFARSFAQLFKVFIVFVMSVFLVDPASGIQSNETHGRVSAATRFVPPDFDKQQRYATFTSDELWNEYKDVIGINNNFIGKRVKVFGKFVPLSDDGINREFSTLFKNYGCSQPVCSHVTTLQYLDVSTSLHNYLTFQDVVIVIRFPSDLKEDLLYQSLVTASKSLCTSGMSMRPCLLWVKGRLDYLPVKATAPLGTLNLKLLCVDVEEYRVYEGHGNDSWESFKLGVGFGKKISDFFKSSSGDR